MKRFLTIIPAVAVLVAVFAFTLKNKERRAEEEAVKELVMKAYVNGAFNKLDTKAMSKGFHEDFAIFSANGEQIRKYPIAKWIENTEKKKADNYDPADPKNIWEPTFALVDVTGGSAQVKIELRNQGKHIFTDYLSLLRFDSGWKIVAKVYHRHE